MSRATPPECGGRDEARARGRSSLTSSKAGRAIGERGERRWRARGSSGRIGRADEGEEHAASSDDGSADTGMYVFEGEEEEATGGI